MRETVIDETMCYKMRETNIFEKEIKHSPSAITWDRMQFKVI